MREYNIVIVGDDNAGKSSYIERVTTGNLSNDKMCSGTFRIEISTGTISINLVKGMDIKSANAVIIMIDLSREISSNVLVWYNDIYEKYGKIPIVVCGNKSEEGTLGRRKREFYKDRKITYYEISCKHLKALEKPGLGLLKKLKVY